MGVSRGRVPREQLDSPLRGLFRPLCDDVSHNRRGGSWRTSDRWPAILQPVDAADRPRAARAHRRRSAARVAEVDLYDVSNAVPVADHDRPRCSGRARRARRARVDLGHLLRALRVRVRDDRSGVLARRPRPAEPHRHRRADGDDWSRQQEQASLRRHRPDLLRLRRRGLQALRERPAQAGTAGRGPGLHGPDGCAQGDRRRSETDGHVASHRVSRRQRDRQDVPGEVVLPEARERADDRGCDSPLVLRRPVSRAGRVRREGTVVEPGDDRQPACGLGLDGLWCAGHRHRHRSPAGTGVLVRDGAAAGRGRDEHDAAAVAAAHARRACCADGGTGAAGAP